MIEELGVLKELNIEVREASHPIPDERSVEAANEVLELLKQEASERTLVVCCISGGGSALFCSPRHPLGLEDLADTNARLLQSGMAIQDMNVIRKRLERGKGGKLASHFAYPSTLLTLVLSDIIGDPLDLIASGPTVPDPSNWEMAMKLVDQYQLNKEQANALPQSVLELLQQGVDGTLDDGADDAPSTPSHPMFCTSRGNENESSMLSETILVGNNELAVMAAAHEAKQRGYHPIVLGTRIEGEAQTVAGVYTAMAEQLSRQRRRQDNALLYSMCPLPAAIIAGGETTVTLKTADGGWTGKGGRNQEIGLAAALQLQALQLRNVVLASVGTDGTDGPTDAAGAIVDGGTVDRVEHANQGSYTAQSALQHHDAYTFFNSMEELSPIPSSPTTTSTTISTAHDETDSDTKFNVLPLVKTGPTGTNVADVCITLVR
jgi:glycerate 2-kinase